MEDSCILVGGLGLRFHVLLSLNPKPQTLNPKPQTLNPKPNGALKGFRAPKTHRKSEDASAKSMPEAIAAQMLKRVQVQGFRV